MIAKGSIWPIGIKVGQITPKLGHISLSPRSHFNGFHNRGMCQETGFTPLGTLGGAQGGGSQNRFVFKKARNPVGRVIGWDTFSDTPKGEVGTWGAIW